MKQAATQNHYATLEIEPGASAEAVRTAWERLRRLLGPESLAMYSLVEPAEQERMLLQIDEAYAVLSDADARHRYDREQGFPPAPEATQARAPAGLGFGEALARIESAQKRSRSQADELVVEDADLLEVVEVAPAAAEIVDADEIGALAVEEVPENRQVSESPGSVAGAPVAAETPAPAPAIPAAAEPAAPGPAIPAAAEPAAPGPAIPAAGEPAAPGPAIPAVSEAPAAQAPTPTDDLPAIDDQTVFTGALLRRVRQARCMGLDELAARTRIGAAHFANIEDERWQDLPERVYLRGYLESYARELRLDPVRVCATFLARAPSARKR